MAIHDPSHNLPQGNDPAIPSEPNSYRIVLCAPDGATAALLRGLGLEAGTDDTDKLDLYRGAVAMVVVPNENAAGVMRGAVMAKRLCGIATKVVRGPSAEDFKAAAWAGADPLTWTTVVGAADLPPWTPEDAEADVLDAEARSGEDEALDLALAAGREPVAVEEPEPWEDPIPLDGAVILPPFPLDALPAHLAGFVRELAASLEVHVDMPAAFALGVCAAACQGKFRVHVRADHWEPLNLFLGVALPPAELKSATIRECLLPLNVYQEELQERERANVAIAIERHQVLLDRIKELRGKAAKGKKESDRSDASRELEAIVTNLEEPPVLPRLTAGGDILPEALGSLLNRHGGRMTVCDAEGGVFFANFAGRYSSGSPNFEILLKAHAGDDAQIDRQGRPPIQVLRPCLTVILAVQPDVVRHLADTPQFRERGLAGRFLFCFPEPRAGHRGFDGMAVSDTARALYGFGIRAALELAPKYDDAGREVAQELTLSPEALEVYREMARALMAQIRDGGELHGIQDWAGKAHGAAARVTGVLHALEHSAHGKNFVNSVNSVLRGVSIEKEVFLSSLESSSCVCGGDPSVVPISAITVARAWQIINYFKTHALHAYSLMGADAETEMARRILAWVRKLKLKRFPLRDCHRRFQADVKKAADLNAPLSLLVERHYFRREPDTPRPLDAQGRKKPGQKPSPGYTVNPLWKN